jgi:hypothetical protein
MLVLDSLPVTPMIGFHSQEPTAATQQTQACREPPNILARTRSRTHSRKFTRKKKLAESDYLTYNPQAPRI